MCSESDQHERIWTDSTAYDHVSYTYTVIRTYSLGNIYNHVYILLNLVCLFDLSLVQALSDHSKSSLLMKGEVSYILCCPPYWFYSHDFILDKCL